jgi:hypothetical protein
MLQTIEAACANQGSLILSQYRKPAGTTFRNPIFSHCNAPRSVSRRRRNPRQLTPHRPLNLQPARNLHPSEDMNDFSTTR